MYFDRNINGNKDGKILVAIIESCVMNEVFPFNETLLNYYVQDCQNITLNIMNSNYSIIFWFFNGKNNILWMALLWITSLGLENVTIALLIVGINANLFLDLIICKVRLGILVINTWRLIWNNSKFCINYHETWFYFLHQCKNQW